MSVELEMSEGVAESEKKNSGAPEIENHTRMADLSELLKGRRKHTSRQENKHPVCQGDIRKELFKLTTTALDFTYCKSNHFLSPYI